MFTAEPLRDEMLAAAAAADARYAAGAWVLVRACVRVDVRVFCL